MPTLTVLMHGYEVTPRNGKYEIECAGMRECGYTVIVPTLADARDRTKNLVLCDADAECDHH